MKLIDIGALAKVSGCSASTLRYYEEIGLIKPVARNGLGRQYNEETIAQLALITLGKAGGFSLEEIRSLFDGNQTPTLTGAALHQKADELDSQIERMTIMSRLLRHVAECPAPSHMECPRFRTLLLAASTSADAGRVRKALAKRSR